MGTTPTPQPPSTNDVFDQISGSTPTPPQPSTSSQSSTPQQISGDVFDQIANGSNVSSTQANQPAPVHGQISFDPSDNFAQTALKGTEAIGAGIGDGLLGTLNGGASMLHLPHATLQARQDLIEGQNKENPTLNAIGYGGETLLEFLTGDEALKGLALSDRLMKSAGVAKALEQSPRLMKALQIGADALRSGAVGGTQGTVRSGGDLGKGAEEGATTAAIAGTLGMAGQAVKAIRGALDVSGIQAPLQDSLRGVVSDVADRLGLQAPTSASLRDVVQDVQSQLQVRASGLYKQMDQLSGGEAQRFRDAAKNVADELREKVGLISPKREAALVAKQQAIDAAHQAMLDRLEAAGHPRDLLAKADALWKQQAALTDLQSALRQSVSGIRPELATATGTTETVNPKVLFTKLNRLHDSGRLTQAIGPENAKAILQTVDNAYARAQAIAQNNRWARYVAGAAASAGLGGLGYEGVKFAHNLLGGK